MWHTCIVLTLGRLRQEDLQCRLVIKKDHLLPHALKKPDLVEVSFIVLTMSDKRS